MNAWRNALRLWAILALVVTASTGCLAESEEQDPTNEAAEGLASADDSSSDSSDGTDSTGTPKANHPTATVERDPDPLPWHELAPAPENRRDTRSGPDPLPWVPDTVSTGGTGSSTGHDGK